MYHTEPLRICQTKGGSPTQYRLVETESERILAAANVVTLSRTGVEYDYRGDVIDAHAPEMPTRFAKQLAQVMRGALALGMARPDALRLALASALAPEFVTFKADFVADLHVVRRLLDIEARGCHLPSTPRRASINASLKSLFCSLFFPFSHYWN